MAGYAPGSILVHYTLFLIVPQTRALIHTYTPSFPVVGAPASWVPGMCLVLMVLDHRTTRLDSVPALCMKRNCHKRLIMRSAFRQLERKMLLKTIPNDSRSRLALLDLASNTTPAGLPNGPLHILVAWRICSERCMLLGKPAISSSQCQLGP